MIPLFLSSLQRCLAKHPIDLLYDLDMMIIDFNRYLYLLETYTNPKASGNIYSKLLIIFILITD